MQIEAVTAFVNVNQRNDIGPPCRIHCADVGDLLQLEEVSRVHIRHETLARIWPRGSGGGPLSLPSLVFGGALLTCGLLLDYDRCRFHR